METETVFEKLKILADSAKYDVSCSSSGSSRKREKGGTGNAAPYGICHSYTEDGRCISLLKVLYSNDCSFDCLYCGCRHSQDVPRATFEPRELAELIIGFYKRNYIEGLFLSSAVYKNADYTMTRMTETVRLLRNEYGFCGYIHMKGIPGASYDLVRGAASLVDRMSFNIELPTERSLKLLAPQKNKDNIVVPMSKLATEFIGQGRRKTLIPAGQTTQMIVGASPESDGEIVRLSEALYQKFRLKRVYYSSFIPVARQSTLLPALPGKLVREHRLYQADWLLRFYGFTAGELLPAGENFSDEYDPKFMWALKNYGQFPVEVNRAPLELLLRVPGIGVDGANKILRARRYTKLSFDDLKRIRITLKRAVHFITCDGKFFGVDGSTERIMLALKPPAPAATQLSFFDDEAAYSALSGQL